MSHFTVLVAVEADSPDEVEEKVDEALAPYSENLEVEPYWTEEAPSFEEWWDRKYHVKQGNVPADVTFDDFLIWLRTKGEDGDRYRLAADGSIERETTYNPKSKWDWYQIGGRWSGSLPLKQPVAATEGAGLGARSWASDPEPPLPDRADYARKGDIDIEGARAIAALEAEATWGLVEAIVAEHGQPLEFRAVEGYAEYAAMSDKSSEEAKALIQKVRDAYHGQPAIVAAKESKLLEGFFDSWDDKFAGFTRETYVRYHRNRAISGYAFLGGEVGWMSPGRMGWFGMSSDENADRIAYAERFAAILDRIPDTEYLVMVDCHI